MVNLVVPAGSQRLKKLFFKITSRNSMQTSNVSELVNNIPVRVLTQLLNPLGQTNKIIGGMIIQRELTSIFYLPHNKHSKGSSVILIKANVTMRQQQGLAVMQNLDRKDEEKGFLLFGSFFLLIGTLKDLEGKLFKCSEEARRSDQTLTTTYTLSKKGPEDPKTFVQGR